MLVFLSAGKLKSMNIRTVDVVVLVVVIFVVFVIIAVVVVVIFVVVVALFLTQPHRMMGDNAHWYMTRPRLFPTSLGVSEQANE